MMENKNILFIYYRLFKAGGLTKVLVNLCNELVSEGHNVTILLLIKNNKSFYKLDEKVNVIVLDTFSSFEFNTINVFINKYLNWIPKRQILKNYIYDFGQWRFLRHWLKINYNSYDIIVSTYYKLSAQLSINRRVNKKTIAWEHNSFYHGGFLWFGLLRKYYKNLMGIVCINKPGYEKYKLLNKNTVLIRNIIGNSYEQLAFKPFIEKNNQILLVGRLDDQKNISEFIEILSQVDLKDWCVKIVGTGPQLNLLSDLIESKRLEDKIELVGQKTEKEVINYQLISKITCLTSIEEGFGMVLIEGLFTSNALIAYDCNYGPSDIVNERNGFLVKLHDKSLFQQKLQFLIKNPTYLEKISKSSYLESDNWRKDKIIDKWNEIFKSC